MSPDELGYMPPLPLRTDWRIGAIGTGFIMRDVQLRAYRDIGLQVHAIAGTRREQAEQVARSNKIPVVHPDYRALLADSSLDILDIAVPPHIQTEIIDEAVASARNVRGILAQKPLAMSYTEAVRTVEVCEAAGVTLAVNQNMRYDQSIRALKTLLDRGDLGEPVLATIEMRAIPHWQTWLQSYSGLTLSAMSIHHLDCFRFLFGDPDSVYVSARSDPRTRFPHRDGIVLYILEWDSGLRASAWDDVWAGPAREGAASDLYIRWRVEGTEGLAQGTIGWPGYPNAVPSTIRYATTRHPGVWISPEWKEVWFPDAFRGTMGELLDSITEGREPAISGRENLGTMALVEACYRSLDEHRPIEVKAIARGAAH
ncbi:MAG TPA: Gfo/Idh/MocA family oxidoreductase [Bryobacteraceae bacterium]|nr:Gfo/Idh/MocA family oxidoreductase [Bryobacteraceae bacterium]